MPRELDAARLAGGAPRFISDRNVFSEQELESLPHYRLFARKQDVPCGGLLIDRPGHFVGVSLNRKTREGPFHASRQDPREPGLATPQWEITVIAHSTVRTQLLAWRLCHQPEPDDGKVTIEQCMQAEFARAS